MLTNLNCAETLTLSSRTCTPLHQSVQHFARPTWCMSLLPRMTCQADCGANILVALDVWIGLLSCSSQRFGSLGCLDEVCCCPAQVHTLSTMEMCLARFEACLATLIKILKVLLYVNGGKKGYGVSVL